jgi:hypothetical protein
MRFAAGRAPGVTVGRGIDRPADKQVFSNSGMSLKVVGKEEESGGGLGSTVDGAEEL